MMVVRDEAHRYLREAVASLRLVVDGLLVYDDGSKDKTPQIAAAEGAYVVKRPDNVPAWTQHEGRCREAAWKSLPRLGIDLGDWVVSVDADEFLVTPFPDRRAVLMETIAQADEESAFAISLRIHEIFGWQGEQPMVRIDGWWGKITGLRMMRWGLSTQFPDEAMGSGSVPGRNHRFITAERFSLVHMGYARESDRREKAARYAASPGRHSTAHINSILKKGKQVEWAGELPCGPS